MADKGPTADDIVFLISHHGGYGYRDVPDDLLDAFIHYEWNSGRWVALTQGERKKIIGWISWYNLDSPSLEQVKEFGLPGCFFQKIPLHEGEHCYLANLVIKEGLPNRVFRFLWQQACLQNQEAKTISAHLCNRPKERQPEKNGWRWYHKPNRAYRQPETGTREVSL